MTLGNMRKRARALKAAANKRKKPLGIGRAARCQELPSLTRFRSPLNNALLPVMFRACAPCQLKASAAGACLPISRPAPFPYFLTR
jgi:hypothetical protein